MLISTNHYGRFAFRLCPLSATKNEDCTELQRCVRRTEVPFVGAGRGTLKCSVWGQGAARSNAVCGGRRRRAGVHLMQGPGAQRPGHFAMDA